VANLLASRKRLVLTGWVTISLLCCQPPAPLTLQGKVTEAVQRGIDSGRGVFDHALWDQILKAHAREAGRKFDYAGLKKKDEAQLNAYLDSLSRADLSWLGRDELMALLINAYNAYTVKTVLGAVTAEGEYRIFSIREIPRVFDGPKHSVGGFGLTLDNIEHNLLRPLFRDPRVHFAVNCASISCPPLLPEAFSGARLDQQLEEATRLALVSPDYLRVEEDRLRVTKILDWYGEDFVNPGWRGAEKDLVSYLRRYASDEVRRFLGSRTSAPQIEFMDYDWGLNRP